MVPKSIIISGTSGVGKTTIAKALASRIGLKYLRFSSFVIGRGLYSKYDPLRDTFIVDMDRALPELIQLVRKQPFVIDSVIPDILPVDYVKLVIVLRLDPWILAHRLIKRGWKLRKVLENVEAELLGVCLQEALNHYGSEIVYEIDVTGRKVEALVSEIEQLLFKGVVVGRVGVVDWLSKYDNPLALMRKIEEYFRAQSSV